MNTQKLLQIRNSFILGVACCALPYVASAETIRADFAAGNTSSQVDGYIGTGGDGWLGSWAPFTSPAATATFSNSVLNTNPLNGGGNYLDANFTYAGASGVGQGTTNRGFSTETVDVSAPVRYTFDYRIDTALSNGNQNYKVFNRVGGTASGTDSNDTWVIHAIYNSPSSTTWYVLDGNGAGGAFSNINTGFEVVAGTVYSFIIDTDPANKSWGISITDGISTYTNENIGFRVNSTSDGNFLHFGASASPGSTIGFSLDSLSIASIPEVEVSAAVLGIASLLALYARCRSRRAIKKA